jgi:hypothetical protein
MAGGLLVVEVGSCTVSQDRLRKQSTMYVLEICPFQVRCAEGEYGQVKMGLHLRFALQ